MSPKTQYMVPSAVKQKLVVGVVRPAPTQRAVGTPCAGTTFRTSAMARPARPARLTARRCCACMRLLPVTRAMRRSSCAYGRAQRAGPSALCTPLFTSAA